ncbi:hypothetical protein Cme02nite_27020 [Catellatospora methionotrophica]|uniref:Uncharacterized protein n=1 Tax=Catellatospora methionotrophica TaxID=121620 RepID=A0A8J3LKG7_9ACTN|nr:hypothetical protein [Catellatospora methionotrophica]GIG14370.1 hypothetical protein Cme02nite_27020 [Catellatospora methionotrophica]
MLSRIPLRPRTVVALGLAAVVAMIVALGKLLGDAPPPVTSPAQPPVASPSAVDPHEGDDGLVQLDPTPSPMKANNGPQAISVATKFAQQWIKHDRSAAAWLDSLRPHSTKALVTELDGVDPAGVPADRITGAARMEALADSFVEVVFPIDAGLLRLRLVASGGKWLVDGVDWERV